MAEKKNNEITTIPVEGIQLLEIDRAVYDWFDKTNETVLDGKKTPVIFGAWERFAQIQGNKADKNINRIRDRNGKIKLPIISIRRGDVLPNENRYLKVSERQEVPYITYQKRIATSKFDKDRRVPFTNKWIKGDSQRYVTSAPVYEVISIPYPTFVNVNYMITFWASYVKHSVEFHKRVWNEYRINDLKYNDWFFYSWFDSSSDESNLEDFTTEERIIRHMFVLNVEGYLIDKSSVTINRTPSRFIFEETVIDVDEISPTKPAITDTDGIILESFGQK